MKNLNEQWQVNKPVAHSDKGVVSSQHVTASQAGLEVMAAGGNAVDAAVATALALGIVEPWMSGLGGCGYMLVYLAKERRVQVVDFGTRSPVGLNPADYPLTGEAADSDLFGWPAVEGARNVHGPLSIGLPGTVDGLALSLERFGTLPWAEVSAPAIALAKTGHPITWWTTLKVAGEAATLRDYEPAASTYLPQGLPPLPGEMDQLHLDLGALAQTFERLAEAGPRDFYEGEIARQILADLASTGCTLSADDLASYQAKVREPLTISRNAAELHLLPGLTAGPSFAEALTYLGDFGTGGLGPTAYAGYAEGLHNAYAKRLVTMGHDGDAAGRGSTTHLSVVDGEGNMVALTNTLLSLFGSNVLLPGTGVLMNNGIMWFDPSPGRPNSLAAGKRPLCNICPVIATRDGTPWFALGASGGRRILPAVFQLTSFLVDGGMDLEAAAHQPRLNVDGGAQIQIDDRLGPDVSMAIADRLPDVPLRSVPALAMPNLFANPLAVLCADGGFEGIAQIPSPVSAACGL